MFRRQIQEACDCGRDVDLARRSGHPRRRQPLAEEQQRHAPLEDEPRSLVRRLRRRKIGGPDVVPVDAAVIAVDHEQRPVHQALRLQRLQQLAQRGVGVMDALQVVAGDGPLELAERQPLWRDVERTMAGEAHHVHREGPFARDQRRDLRVDDTVGNLVASAVRMQLPPPVPVVEPGRYVHVVPVVDRQVVPVERQGLEAALAKQRRQAA